MLSCFFRMGVFMKFKLKEFVLVLSLFIVFSSVEVMASTSITVNMKVWGDNNYQQYSVTLPDGYTASHFINYGYSNIYYYPDSAVHPCLYLESGYYSYKSTSPSHHAFYVSINTSYSLHTQTDFVIGGIDVNYLVSSSIPIFSSESYATEYVNTGKVTDPSAIIPDGYYVDDNGNLVKSKYDSTLGYPLEYSYYPPGDGDLNKPIFTTTLSQKHTVTWKNKVNTPGYAYRLQIQLKGTYQCAKTTFYLSRDSVTSDYVDIDMVPKDSLIWSKDERSVDLGKESPIYLNIASKLGYSPVLGSIKRVNVISRARYVLYDPDGNMVAYGPWVKSNATTDGITTVVTDDKDTNIQTDEYGNGKSQTEVEFDKDGNLGNYSIISTANDIIASMGEFPKLMTALLGFMPPQVLALIGTSITALIGIAIYKAIRG